jgi:hypothetical protein
MCVLLGRVAALDGWRGAARAMHTIVSDHIEMFYNRNRHQAGLDHGTPVEVDATALAG